MAPYLNRVLVLVCTASIALTGCWSPFLKTTSPPKSGDDIQSQVPKLTDAAQAVQITVLATNDIHGGVEPNITQAGLKRGGLAILAGAVKAIRSGIQKRLGPSGGGVVLVDAGDQFQGTLVSNFNEGKLVYDAMSEMQYDAVVPGNHAYDFGPEGWLKDRATLPGENPRGVIEKLAESAGFSLLSANTYLKESLSAVQGAGLDVDDSCRIVSRPTPTAKKRRGGVPGVQSRATTIQWSKAERPAFLKPYVIKTVAGVRVALIGMDHPQTTKMTTVANVSDLCFRDPVETYRDLRTQMGSLADVFVLVIHHANAPGQYDLSDLVRTLRKDPDPKLDVVIAGHTHMIQNDLISGVPIIQSGDGGERLGRVDLSYDVQKKALVSANTRAYSGVPLNYEACDPGAKSFCREETLSDSRTAARPKKGIYWEGELLEPVAAIETLVADARAAVSGLAGRVLGTAIGPLGRDRINESAISNVLTDALRDRAGVDIAFMNTGGIRATVKAGKVTYEQLFEVLPFNNHGVIAGPMDTARLMALLERSIKTCGLYGALMQSGLRVSYTRDCETLNRGGVDNHAKLLRVETLSGELIYDAVAQPVPTQREFRVATLDFLLDGGSGFDGFKGLPLIQEMDIVREALTDQFLSLNPPTQFSHQVDGRWKNAAAN